MRDNDRVPSQAVNTFEKGLWKDSLASLQPKGTYREGWSLVNKTDDESDFGVSNELANEIFILIPEGAIVRGLIYAEERDMYVAMLYYPSKGLSEICTLDEKHKKYTNIVDDNDLPDGKLDFSEDEWISGMELKYKAHCNELELYWSSRYWYNYINLDDVCKDYSIAKFRLFRCVCRPSQVTSVLNGGGDGLSNGAYQFICQLEDDDHNKTNWFTFSNPVYIAQKDFHAGDPTGKSIKLLLTDLDKEYTQVNVAVVATIGGKQLNPEIVFRSNYGAGKIELEYTGQKGDLISLQEIQTKNPTYIRGRNMIQKDGSLILYNLLGERNLHYQPKANQIRANYIVGLVPANEAHLVKGLRDDENYAPCIWWNYCDGTRSAAFPIQPGDPTAAQKEIIPAGNPQNCSNCDQPRWAVENTAVRTELNPGFIDPKEGSQTSSTPYDNTEYTAPQEDVVEELIKIPPSLEDILNNNPQDATAGICDCIKQHVTGKVLRFSTDDPSGFPDKIYDFDLEVGPGEDCCNKLQNVASGAGGGLLDGVNEILASMTNSKRTENPPSTSSGGGSNNPRREFPKDPGLIDLPENTLQYVPPTKDTTVKVHDIALTDTNGNSINIQDSLDAGRAVILDFFATYCDPCYTIHTSGMWESLYTLHGPSSTSKYNLDIIGIEMDAYSTDADLNGTGSNTKGDFTNVSYPLVNTSDNETLQKLTSYYNVAYYPYAVIIYPDGQTFNIGTLNAPTVENMLLDPTLTGAGKISTGGNSTGSPTGGGGLGTCSGAGCGSGSTCGSGGCGSGSCGGGGGSCTSCGGSSSTCGGAGSCGRYGSITNLCSYCGGCGNPVSPGGSCFSCNGDYCRHICYEKPQTSKQAIARLLVHRVSTFKAAKYKRTYGLSNNGDSSQGLNLKANVKAGNGGFKYAKVLVYDKDGCHVIEKQYPIVARGKFGYFESSEIYPNTFHCETGYLWGDLHGKPWRMFRTPSSNLEPDFVSFQEGVVNFKDKGNYELQDTWVRPKWFEFYNIIPPTEEELPKPLCPNIPYTIGYQERTQYNKRVLASGLVAGCFLGDYYGRKYAYPKEGVNSIEYVDRNVENNGSHIGEEIDVPAYTFHSPDTSFDRPYLPADLLAIDHEIYGKGFRHGLYAEGKEPDSVFSAEIDQRGTRQSVNLNHYKDPVQTRIKCIKGLSYVDAGTVCEAPDGVTYPLMNMFRNSCLYLEYDKNKALPLQLSTENSVNAARTSDASFVGDGNTHQCPIRKVGGHYGTLINNRKDPYGSIEGAAYIPFGIEGTAESLKAGTISGTAGDSYIGHWSYVNKGFVSNKVGEDKIDDPNFGPFMEEFLCFGDCTKLPNSGNASDTKNKRNLRPTVLNCQNAAFFEKPNSDIYYPRTVKTLVMFWVQSDTNPWYREIGERKVFETYYPQLGTIPLDSSLTGAPFDDCFLNQFAERHIRMERYKKILRPALKVLAFAIPIIWWAKDGLAFKNEYSDWVMFIIRTILFVLFFILLVFIVFTCNNINKFLHIRTCRTDHEGGGDEDNIYGFIDNYFRYNFDYSLNNNLETAYSMDSTYDVRKCLAFENNRIVYSNKQRIASVINSWRNFKVNNYLDLPSESGKLQKIFLVGSKMFLHTTDMIWNVFTGRSEMQLKDGSQIYLGSGALMNNAEPIMGGVVEGWAGLSDPNSAYTTRFGYIFPDREARKWYSFSGDTKAISDEGIHHYLQENMGFKLLEQFPDFKAVDIKIENGIGYSLGIDNKLGRILITKRDYEAKDPSSLTLDSNGKTFNGGSTVKDTNLFNDRSFTLSYDVEDKKWISNHYYAPLLYAWNRYDMYGFDEKGMWKFNIKGKFQTFFGKFYPFYLEWVVRNEQSLNSFKYVSTELKSECEEWDGEQYLKGRRNTFNKMAFYNSHQSSGYMNIVDKDTLTGYEAAIQDFDRIVAEFNRRNWQMADAVDKLSDYNKPVLLLPGSTLDISDFNIDNHLSNPDIQNNILDDNYLVNRGEFSIFDDRKLIVKQVVTELDNNVK